eukprot:gene26815-32958_t
MPVGCTEKGGMQLMPVDCTEKGGILVEGAEVDRRRAERCAEESAEYAAEKRAWEEAAEGIRRHTRRAGADAAARRSSAVLVRDLLHDLVNDRVHDLVIGLVNDLESRAVFVDEGSCIGCLKCALAADRTFGIDMETGKARVVAQWGDAETEIKTGFASCPVNCIHWVQKEDLPVLEHVMKQQ